MGTGKEQQVALSEKKDADKYSELKDDLLSKQLKLQLFKLYHCERKIAKYNTDWFQKRENVTNIEKGNEKLESDLKKVKKDYSKSQRDFTKVESEIREKDNLLQKRNQFSLKQKRKLVI